MLSTPLQFLTACLGYYVAGRVGLMLAIPPGFASAVWPATGVALFCAIRFHPFVVCFAVALASLLLNLGTTTEQFSLITWQGIQPVLFIALGAAFQTLFSYYIFKRYLGLSNSIDSPKSIVLFALLVAVFGSSIAPIFGVSSLYFHGIINAENTLFNFLTWWSGDSIGVLLFTPLLLTIFSQDKNLTLTRKLQITLPVVVIFSACWLLFSNSIENKHRLIDNTIRTTASRLFLKVDENFRLSENKLNAYSAFFNASNEITIQDFNDFSRVILKEDRVFQAVGWTKIVKHHEKEKTIQSIRNNGYPNFKFTQFSKNGELQTTPNKAEYYPVLYIFPLEHNQRAFGLDLSANAQRLTALKLAKATASPIATAPIKLAQETSDSWATILYIPIFGRDFDRVDLSPDNIDRYFHSYISGVFRFNGLFNSVLNEAHDLAFDMQVRDITDLNSPQILIDATFSPLSGYQAYKHEVNFGQRSFEVSIFAHDGFKTQLLDWTSWSILTSGFFIASLFQMFILLITGVTENTRNQVRLKTHDLLLATKQAEHANQVKSQFLSNMSHELRTPLNAISGFIDISLNTQPAEKVVSSLLRAKQSLGSLLSLINQMFEFSNLQNGRVSLQPSLINLTLLIKKINQVFVEKSASSSVKFSINLDDNLPNTIIGDGEKLEKILLALCANAMKFTHKGHVTLTIYATPMNAKTIFLIFEVQDTGIGIKASQRKKIFSGFDQVDNTSTRAYGGTGLGLATSIQFIKLMNGTLTLTSELGKGSLFRVELPFELAIDEQPVDTKPVEIPDLPVIDPSKVSRQGLDTQRSPALFNCKILLVEDNEINQMVALELLGDLGALVDVAADGQIAVDRLTDNSDYDLILMDIQMPNMDGLTATRVIRQLTGCGHIPIVAMTANTLPDDIVRCTEAGMLGHIKKPIDQDELVTVLAQFYP